MPIFSEWVSLEKLGTRGLGTRGDRGKMEYVGCSWSSWVSGWGYVSCGCCVKQRSEVKVTQLCPTLCNPHGLYSPWNSPGQNTGVCGLSLLQGIFPTQELNQGLLHGVARITPHHIRAFSFTLASTLSCHWKWRGSVELCQVCIGLEPPRRGSEPHTASITPITVT